MRRSCVRHELRTEGETEEFGARLARARPPGEQLAVLFLCGDLGAGKTTLVRGFLNSLGVTRPVTSPTYTLVELYELGSMTAVHADLYRLRDAGELEVLGLRDWAQNGYLWFVEWPERAVASLPAPDLTLCFSAGTAAHVVELQPGSDLGAAWLAQLGGGPAGARGAR